MSTKVQVIPGVSYLRYHPDFIMCVFCEGLVATKMDYTKTQYCKNCNEYKGLMTVRDFHEQYGSESLVPSWIN